MATFSWTLSKAGGPKRANHAAVVVRNLIYSFGGLRVGGSSKDEMDVHVFNTVSLCWKELSSVNPGVGGHGNPEVPRSGDGHTAVLVEDTVYIWGGWRLNNVVYLYDVETDKWLKTGRVSGTVPEARFDHSACVLGKAMFIYGGYGYRRFGEEVYKFDTITMVWTLIGVESNQHCTWDHSATMIGTRMFVFGGEWKEGLVNKIRVFDTENNLWLWPDSTQILPDERNSHSAFDYNGELYIFGGYDWSETLNDLWKFNPKTFSWKKVEPKGKGPGPLGEMSCCMVGERVVIFGGLKYRAEEDPRLRRPTDELYVLDLNPNLKTLCKLAVIQYDLDRSELPHDTRWELAAVT